MPVPDLTGECAGIGYVYSARSHDKGKLPATEGRKASDLVMARWLGRRT